MYCKFENGANCKLSWNWPLTSRLAFCWNTYHV